MKHAVAALVTALSICGVAAAASTPALAVVPKSAEVACSTWQYRISADYATVRWVPGGGFKANALHGDLANVSDRNDGVWYFGNFYDRDTRAWYTNGWVLAEKLDYIRCW